MYCSTMSGAYLILDSLASKKSEAVPGRVRRGMAMVARCAVEYRQVPAGNASICWEDVATDLQSKAACQGLSTMSGTLNDVRDSQQKAALEATCRPEP